MKSGHVKTCQNASIGVKSCEVAVQTLSLPSSFWDRVLPIHVTNGQEFQGMFLRNFQFLFGFICQSWICKSLTPRQIEKIYRSHDPMAPLMLLIDVGSCWFIWIEVVVLVMLKIEGLTICFGSNPAQLSAGCSGSSFWGDQSMPWAKATSNGV